MLRASRRPDFSSFSALWLEALEARNVLTMGLSFLAPPALTALEAVNPTGSEIAELPVLSEASTPVANSLDSLDPSLDAPAGPALLQSITTGEVSNVATELPSVVVDAAATPASVSVLEPIFGAGETLHLVSNLSPGLESLTNSLQGAVSIAVDAVADISTALPEIVQGGDLSSVTGIAGSLLVGADGLLDTTLGTVNSLTQSTLTSLTGTVDQLLATTEPLLASLGLPRLDLIGDLLDGATTLVGNLVEGTTSLTGNLTGAILAVAGEALVSLPGSEIGTEFSTSGEELAPEAPPLSTEAPAAQWIMSLLPLMEASRDGDTKSSPKTSSSTESAGSRDTFALTLSQPIAWMEGAVASVADGISTSAPTEAEEGLPGQDLPNRASGNDESFDGVEGTTGVASLAGLDSETMLDLAMGIATQELEIALTPAVAESTPNATAESLLLTAEIAPAVFLLLLSRSLPEQEAQESRRRRRTNGAVAGGVDRRAQSSSIGRRGGGVLAVDSAVGLRDHAVASLVESMLPAVVSLPADVAQEASGKQEPGSLVTSDGLPLLAVASGLAKVAWNRAKHTLRRTGRRAVRTSGR